MRQSAHGIARMAQIGTKGRHPQNTSRDLMQLLGRSAGSHPMEWFEMAVEVAKNRMYSAGYHAEKKRRMKQRWEEEKGRHPENGSTRPQPNITTNAPHRLQGAQGQETHSMCPEAVNLAQFVLDWMKDQPIPRSLAATTATAHHRLLGWPGVRHSPLDPEGFEWEEYQEIGRVLHCTNNIQIDENKITSLVTRLYHHRSDRPPAGLADAWQRNCNSGNFEWYEMYTQNARRQGILSHCNCCKPRRVKNIS